MDNMLVAVRVRPLTPDERARGAESCCAVLGGKIVAISKRGAKGSVLQSQKGVTNEFQFDAAFDANASQTDVYDSSAKSFIPSLLEGVNVTVFAYGATGAGKTHTMMGSERVDVSGRDSATACGIIPSSLSDLFDQVEERRSHGDGDWSITASFLEVYNEHVLDLLKPTGQSLKVCEDSVRGVVAVHGLAHLPVNSAEEVLALLREGNAHRKTEPTAANKVSSRSHAVLQVSVKQSRVASDGRKSIRESQLTLIDLAGSERASQTKNRGARLQEGANINRYNWIRNRGTKVAVRPNIAAS